MRRMWDVRDDIVSKTLIVFLPSVNSTLESLAASYMLGKSELMRRNELFSVIR